MYMGIATRRIFLHYIVLFSGAGNTADLTFTPENQNDTVCVEVFAVDNNVLENRETFTVLAVSEEDTAVQLPSPTTLAVFDDDCKYNV